MRSLVPVAVVALTLSLAACVPAVDVPPTPAPEPTSSAPPLFADEDEALAAAEAAYREFKETGEAILHDGGAGIDRFQSHVTEDWFDRESAFYEDFAATGNHTVGSSELLEIRLQRWSDDAITLYACQDVTPVSVISPTGEDVTPEDRPDIATFEVEFLIEDQRLLLNNSRLWSHGTSCF